MGCVNIPASFQHGAVDSAVNTTTNSIKDADTNCALPLTKNIYCSTDPVSTKDAQSSALPLN